MRSDWGYLVQNLKICQIARLRTIVGRLLPDQPPLLTDVAGWLACERSSVACHQIPPSRTIPQAKDTLNLTLTTALPPTPLPPPTSDQPVSEPPRSTVLADCSSTPKLSLPIRVTLTSGAQFDTHDTSSATGIRQVSSRLLHSLPEVLALDVDVWHADLGKRGAQRCKQLPLLPLRECCIVCVFLRVGTTS